MKRTVIIISLFICCVLSMHAAKVADDSIAVQNVSVKPVSEVPDSLKPDPEDEDYNVKVLKRDPVNIAPQQGHNALDAVMEGRYRGQDKTFSKSIWDHVSLSAGVGMEKIVPTTSKYEFQPLTKAFGSISKQFFDKHTLRATAAIGFGYQKTYNNRIYRVEAGVDYLYNYTANVRGYDPMRPLEVQWLIGGGMTASKMHGKKYCMAPFIKTGVQFSMYAGPYGRLYLEPFVGLTKDNLDYSGVHNWREYDVFYGVNIALAQFLSNNLSKTQRQSVSIRAPWFFEASNGFVFNNSSKLPTFESNGTEFNVGVGKWFSSSVGMRMSFYSNTSHFTKHIQEATATRPQYTRVYNEVFTGGSIDGMINLPGLCRNYNWDKAILGINVVAGLGLGWMTKFGDNTEHISTRAITYNIGMQFWAKLSRDVRLFLEPRYSIINYSEPYSNVDWNKQSNDKMMTWKLGLTMLLRSQRYRNDSTYTITPAVDTDRRIAVGFGGGFPITQTKGYTFKEGSHFSTNWMVYGQYMLNRYHSFRLSVEYLNLKRSMMSGYYDVQHLEEGVDRKSYRTGLINASNGLLISTLAYHFDFTELLSGASIYHPVQVSLFVGAGNTQRVRERITLYEGEIMEEGHDFQRSGHFTSTGHFTLTCGAKLTYNLGKRVGVIFIPSVYLIHKLNVPGYSLPSAHNYIPLETMYFGLQYRL